MKYVKITALAIVLTLINATLLSLSEKYGLFLGCINNLLVGIYFHKRNNKRELIAYLAASISFVICVVLLYAIFRGFSKLNFLGYIYILIYIISSLVGFRTFSLLKQNLLRATVILTLYFGAAFTISIVLPTLISQRDFYGTYTGEFENNIDMASVKFIDTQKNPLYLKYEKKVIILDFWNNNCGVCFEKFPETENLQKKYSENNSVQFYAVNSYKTLDEVATAEKLLAQNNVTLENLFLPDSISKSLSIEGFPTILVLKNNKIIFRGSIETLDLFENKYLE